MCRRVSILWRSGYVSVYRIINEEPTILHGLMYLNTVDKGTVIENVGDMVEWLVSPVWEKI